MQQQDRSPETHADYFFAALMFYSRIPVPAGARHSDQILHKSRMYFPVVGWVIGLIAALVFILSQQVLPLTLAVLLSMVASILATGAFHEDGFADSCDGLGGGWNTEQVLTIMKDSRVGTYATVGLSLLLAIKFFSLLELARLDSLLFVLIYIGAHSVSRIFSSLVIEHYDYVQDIDKSKIKPIANRKLERKHLQISILLALLPLLLLLVIYPSMTVSLLIAVVVAGLCGFCFAAYSARRIGGYTGDILGAIQQIAELIFYLTLLAVL